MTLADTARRLLEMRAELETIRRTLDGEFYFYCRIFGIEPADAPEKVDIKNLPRR